MNGFPRYEHRTLSNVATDRCGIIIEGLVEIAQAEEDDSLRIAPLDLEVLASNRGRL